MELHFFKSAYNIVALIKPRYSWEKWIIHGCPSLKNRHSLWNINLSIQMKQGKAQEISITMTNIEKQFSFLFRKVEHAFPLKPCVGLLVVKSSVCGPCMLLIHHKPPSPPLATGPNISKRQIFPIFKYFHTCKSRSPYVVLINSSLQDIARLSIMYIFSQQKIPKSFKSHDFLKIH